jgi:hypothetical protein
VCVANIIVIDEIFQEKSSYVFSPVIFAVITLPISSPDQEYSEFTPYDPAALYIS